MTWKEHNEPGIQKCNPNWVGFMSHERVRSSKYLVLVAKRRTFEIIIIIKKKVGKTFVPR